MRIPDFNNILKVLRCEEPDRPTLFEFFMNGPLDTFLAGFETDPDDELGQAKHDIFAFKNAGYDYATSWGLLQKTLHFPSGEQARKSSVSMNDGALITDRESFENYQWPEIDTFEYSQYEKIKPFLPEGMKIIVNGPGGVLENTVSLVGYENLCIMSVEDPDLLQKIFDAVGSRLADHYTEAVKYDTVGALIGNDDWGFNTQTMLPPADLDRYVFKWHRRIVEIAHDAGMPAILHSCGNLSKVMDVVIDDIGYDGKHSFEDKIQPVEEAYEQYGDRIAIMGGIDVDFICRRSPEEVYERSANMLDRAEGRGGFALGSGNSIPTYVPDEGYLAMIRAAAPDAECQSRIPVG